MDFNESAYNFDDMLRNTDFPPHFDQLELDSLLYGNDDSQESSFSSSFAFDDKNNGFRSRDGGSLGDSSSDSSPPLSCANFPEHDQEMWDFGFQNQSPFDANFEQHQYGASFQEENVQVEKNNGYMENQYIEDEEILKEPHQVQQKRIITILPKPQIPVKRVTTRAIQKVYRVKEAPGTQSQTYRVVQQMNPDQRMTVRHAEQKPMYYTQHSEEIPEQPKSGPLVRQVSNHSEERRYVPIAPTVDIKQEPQTFTPEQNRKIRNRMYAQASRIRKKEAEETLKHSIQELMQENELLKNENIELRQRLAYYEGPQEEPEIRHIVHSGNGRSQKHKKLIAAGSVLMMFGLFAVISPFSVMNLENRVPPDTGIMAISNETSVISHRGRVLENGESTAIIRKPKENIHSFSQNTSHHDCEMYKLNATETRRVNNDIERWVQVHSFDSVPQKFSGGLMNKEAMRKFNEARKMLNEQEPQIAKEQMKLQKAALRSRERTWRQLDLLKSGNNIVDSEKIQKKRQNIDKIASIVRQKGDTLYIMTLQDYVLLPSLKKGSNSIPKLSLLLPSVPMNGTMLDQYSLLRVDCEVTGTGQITLSNKQLSYFMP